MGLLQAPPHPPATDDCHWKCYRSRAVLVPGLLDLSQAAQRIDLASSARDAGRLHDDPAAQVGGHPGLGRELSAEWPCMVAVLRIYREHSLCRWCPESMQPRPEHP